VLAAFESTKIVGFAIAFPALRDGRLYLYSDIIAILPEYETSDCELQLRLAQRDDAIRRGIDLIGWMLDPLQINSAHSDIGRLGAITRCYLPNVYGNRSGCLSEDFFTDRLMVEWWIRSPHVRACLDEKRGADHHVRISLPANVLELCRTNPCIGPLVQRDLRRRFERCIMRGYAAIGFEICGQHASYLMGSYEDGII
jgi:predicted GNAT superfamily acetyltransferase